MTKLSQRPSERARLVRSWIMQTPRPHSLRCTSNGDRQTVLCGSTTWGEVASTVLALNFDTIEALDVSGNVLRATNAIDLFEPELEQLAQQTIPTPPPAPAERERVSVAELVGDDPESRRFALFAHLLADAYRHANDVAFAKLAELSQQQATRASSLERSVDAFVEAERMRVELLRAELESRRRELDEREEEDDDDEEGAGGAFKEAVSKIAKHVAKSVGADDEDDDDDDDDDEGEPAQPQAQPNGAGGH